MTDEDRFHPTTRAEWRAWLAANHDRASGVWFEFWKRKSGRPTVAYEDAVAEALCFGWIDGLLMPIDEERSSIRFSPRRRGSAWARSNKERVERMEAAGLMTEAGRKAVEAARADGSWDLLNDIDAMVVPEELAAALAATEGAREGFEAYSVSARRSLIAWVSQARRPATRSARVAQIVRTIAEGKPAASVWQRRA